MYKAEIESQNTDEKHHEIRKLAMNSQESIFSFSNSTRIINYFKRSWNKSHSTAYNRNFTAKDNVKLQSRSSFLLPI